MFPIHLDLGFNTFYFYEGFYFLISILLGVLLSRYKAKKTGIDMEKFDTFTIFIILGAIVGGRLSNFIFWNTKTLLTQPWKIFFVWEGGISITGGIGGGVLGGWLYARKSALPFWKLFAMFSPFVLLSQAIGRIGCFLNGDAHGIASSLPWAVQFKRYGTTFPTFKKITNLSSIPWQWSHQAGLVTSDSTLSAKLHPTQIYELLLDLVLMVLIIFYYKLVEAKKLSYKLIFFAHMGGYSLYRFFLEFIRADREGLSPLGVSYMQLALAGVFLASIVLSLLSLAKKPQTA